MIGELMTSWSTFINQITDGNQMIAGAMSLWLLGVLTFIAKDVPQKIANFAKKYLTTSMTMNNGGWDEKETMVNFMTWLQPKMRESLSRTLSIQTSMNDDVRAIIGIGYGVHFFFYNKRLFWLNKSKLDSSGSERQKEEISITTIGRSHKPFKKILEDFTPKRDDTKVHIYHLDIDGCWEKYSSPPKRPMTTVAMDETLKDQFKNQIKHFKENRAWFYERGVPYKITYLIHGKPGGGKTSLIKSIASEFNMNICVININQISDKSLERGLAQTPSNSVVIIEDFDSSLATKNRVQINTNANDSDDLGKMFSGLTLTGLLNTLDGVNPLDDCVLFLTTNHIEQIDAALYRKGRVDHIVKIEEIEPEDIRRYSETLYPEHDFSGVTFLRTIGCKLNEALLEGKEDPEAYIDCLVRNEAATRTTHLTKRKALS